MHRYIAQLLHPPPPLFYHHPHPHTQLMEPPNKSFEKITTIRHTFPLAFTRPDCMDCLDGNWLTSPAFFCLCSW